MVIYLDDILEYSVFLSKHLVHLCTVLQHLHEKHLCAKLNKYAFFQHSVDYFGQIIGAGSIQADLAKLEAIQEWQA